MDIRNCRRCGKVYNFNGFAVCPNCTRQEQEDFDKIRDYLFKHPNSSALEVSQATGLELKVITRFQKEGRIESDGMVTSDNLSCEKCGQPVKSGRFCEQCVQKIQAELKKGTNTIANPRTTFQGKNSTYNHILKK
jgi:uncharacterized protein